MNQHEFQSFILKRTKPEYQIQAANLLMQGFQRLNQNGLDQQYLKQWQQKCIPLLIDKNVEEVKEVLSKFAKE